VAAALAVAALVVALPGTAAPPDPWSDAASLLSGRYDHTATRLGNGKVLVMGGASTTFVAAPELYDASANTWMATGGLTSASARQRHTATLLANGKVLIAGGFTANATTNTTRIYDPATNLWSVGPNMVGFRYGHTATLLQNGKVLVVGGNGPLASAELYDPLANSWSSAASPKIGRYLHAATLLQNGKVLVTGGTVGAVGTGTSAAELYDPTTNSWSDAATMPNGRANHTSTLLANGTVLLVGGQDGGTLATASLYNPATNSWSAAASMASPRYLHTTTLLATGKVLVTGGFNVSPSLYSSAELYDPASNLWSSAGSMTNARTRHTATLLGDGQVLVVGGYTGAAVGTTASYIAGVETFATVPQAPTAVTAVAHDASADVTWTAPATTGGTAITSYVVTSSPGGKTAIVNAPATTATATGLTNGTAYTFTVVAQNAQGDSGVSAPSASITPAAVLTAISVTPAAPSIARGTDQQFTATGLYSDATTADLTGTVAWEAGDAGIATVGASGLAQGLSVGTTTVSATLNGVVGSANLSVTATPATLALEGLLQTYDGSPRPISVTTTPTNLDGVSITYDGASEPPMAAGTYAVVASLANPQYLAEDVHGILVVEQAGQTVSFAPLADKAFGTADFTVDANASSGLPVAFAADGDCTVAGSTVHLTGAGTCMITASQAGNGNYAAAKDVAHTFGISKAAQTISFAPLPDEPFGSDDFTLDATASSGLPVAFAADGDCAIAGATVHLTGAGSCTITASQPGNDNYQAAPSVDRTFAIGKATQTIAFAPLADKPLGTADFTVGATASSGLSVTFAAAGSCTASGTAIHLTGAGNCTITASQAGNDNYQAAPSVSRTFAILSISDQISRLSSDIATATPPLTTKLSDDLRKKLANANRAYTSGKKSDACKTMQDFINKVKSEATKKTIPAALATDWVARAEQIRSGIGC